MTWPELKSILNKSDQELIDSVIFARKTNSEAKTFSIMVLEERDLLGKIEATLNKIEEESGSYEDLKKAFLKRHKSNSFSELKGFINQGHFGQLPKSKAQVRSNSSNPQRMAGECIKNVGAAIYEHLIILTLLITGWSISAINASLDPFWFSLGYLIYGIYTLVWIIRIANNLKKAGAFLMK